MSGATVLAHRAAEGSLIGHVATCADTLSSELIGAANHAMLPSMNSIASVLRDGRAALGISQRRLAELMGIAPTFLNDIEHGRRTLGEKYLDRLPAELRVAVTSTMIAHKQAEIAALRKAGSAGGGNE